MRYLAAAVRCFLPKDLIKDIFSVDLEIPLILSFFLKNCWKPNVAGLWLLHHWPKTQFVSCFITNTGGPLLIQFMEPEKMTVCEISTSSIVNRLNWTSTNLLIKNSTSTNFIPIALKILLVEFVLMETLVMGGPPVLQCRKLKKKYLHDPVQNSRFFSTSVYTATKTSTYYIHGEDI